MDIDKSTNGKVRNIVYLQLIGSVVLVFMVWFTYFNIKGLTKLNFGVFYYLAIWIALSAAIVSVYFFAFKTYKQTINNPEDCSSHSMYKFANTFRILLLLIPIVGLFINRHSRGIKLYFQLAREKKIIELFVHAEDTAKHNLENATWLLVELVKIFPKDEDMDEDMKEDLKKKIQAVIEEMRDNIKNRMDAAMELWLEKALIVNFEDNADPALMALDEERFPKGFHDFLKTRKKNVLNSLGQLATKKAGADDLANQYRWLMGMMKVAEEDPLRAVEALKGEFFRPT